jgi:hypothetical protein
MVSRRMGVGQIRPRHTRAALSGRGTHICLGGNSLLQRKVSADSNPGEACPQFVDRRGFRDGVLAYDRDLNPTAEWCCDMRSRKDLSKFVTWLVMMDVPMGLDGLAVYSTAE